MSAKTNPILRKAFRNTSTVQGPSQLILQASISRLAQAERDQEDLRRVRESHAKLQALEARACVVSPRQMESFLRGTLAIVEAAIAHSRERQALENVGVPPLSSVNGLVR